MPEELFIRASSLAGWADCPRRGAARLLWREVHAIGYRLRQLPLGIAAAIGSATHRGAETVLSEKACCGALPPVSVATDAAEQHLAEEVKRGTVAFDQCTVNSDEALGQTIAMTRAYHRETAPLIEPLQIEQQLEAQIAPGLVLTGRPDCVAIEPHSVCDLKTGLRPQNHNAQCGAYALLAGSAGIPIARAAIDFIKRVRPNKPQPAPVRTVLPLAVAENLANSIIGTIARDVAVFRHGDPARELPPGRPQAFASNPRSILCAARYCPAHGVDGWCLDWKTNEQ
jgi:hypothetical protein